LSAFCGNRGELGVIWTNQNAITQPIQLQAKIRLANRALSAQKQSEIINALTSISGSSPFVFDQLSFNASYFKDRIINTIKTIDGVVSVEVQKFGVVPQPISFSGSVSATGTFAEIELDPNGYSQDGFFEVSGTSATAANVFFNKPILPNILGSNFVRDTSLNTQVYDLQFGSASFNAVANDIIGPYVKTDTAGRVEVSQLTNVWAPNQFTGSTWNDRHILKLSWTQDSFQSSSYWHVSGSTYKTLTTQESASSPIFGSKITGSLSSSAVSNVEITLFKDMSQGYLITPIGTTETVLYNDQNTMYCNDSLVLTKVPINEYSFIKFADGTMTIAGSSGSYFSSDNQIRCRLAGGYLANKDNVQIYTSNINSNNLYFKAPQGVFILNASNINLIFV
jgi:hypothetical protein